VSLVVLILVLVLLKFTIKLVDRVICQVHVQVVQVGVIWWLIFFSSESSYPLLMNVDPKRVDSIEQNVDPEVEFEVVDQVRLVDVPLDDASLVFA
jgi:membrane-anchored glycerophosphoryl diester phosphodiesterase (GDPDase)